MHVAFHFVLQPADVNSQRRGLSVLNAIRTFCDVCVRDVLSEPARASQPQSLVRVFLKSHSLGGKSADGYVSSVKKKRATLLAVAVISVRRAFRRLRAAR
jgi:hypothetical protein